MKEKDSVLISQILLKTTFIMLCISVGLKLIGMDIFSADTTNKVLIFVTNFIQDNHLKLIFVIILLYVQTFVFLRLSCKYNNVKIISVVSIILTILITMIQFIVYEIYITNYSDLIYGFVTFFLLFFAVFILDKNNLVNEKNPFLSDLRVKFSRPTKVFVIITIYQIIVMILREITLVDTLDVMYSFLLTIDFLILLLATYYVFINNNSKHKVKGINFRSNKFLNTRISLNDVSNYFTNFKENLDKFKTLDKYKKTVFIIYVLLFILSELFNLGLIVLIAYLNNVLVECFFIITSFMISRKIFGALHLDSAIKCWLVSNLSFFVLNKLTINIGITIAIPILCGIALSYVTSKFIKQTNIEVYRGIPEEDLLKMAKNKKLTKLEMNILIDFYCNKMSLIKLTNKYNYSRTMICEYKLKALKKIEKNT